MDPVGSGICAGLFLSLSYITRVKKGLANHSARFEELCISMPEAIWLVPDIQPVSLVQGFKRG